MATRKKNGLDRRMKRVLTELGVLAGTLVVLILLISMLWSKGGGEEKKPENDQTQPSTGTSTEAPPETTVPKDTSPEWIWDAYLQAHDLTEADYTEGMMEAYNHFPEVRDFILAIPLEKGRAAKDDISGEDRSDGVPLFLQWDQRWGYTEYGNGVCGLSGCGPTSLSMVAYYLTGESKYTPVYMMEFATENGYVGPSGGTNWTLFQEGPEKLGLKSREIPLHEGTMAKYLREGTPIVINVGPGDFTLNGHYMVLVGYEDGMFQLNDPFSLEKSQKLWSYEQIEGQIENLWAITLAES